MRPRLSLCPLPRAHSMNLFPLLFVVALVRTVAALELNWQTTLTQGQNATVSWSGGTAPYELDINSYKPIQTLHKYFGSDFSMWWIVDVSPGSSVWYNVTDSTGWNVHSTFLTVQPNPVLSAASLQSVTSTQSVASVSSISVASVRPKGSHSGSGHGNAGIIAGSAVGGLVALFLLSIGAFFLLRQRNVKDDSKSLKDDSELEGHFATHSNDDHDPAIQTGTPLARDEPALSDIAGGPLFSGTVASMITAPTNADQAFYNRTVMDDRNAYVRTRNS
ncbi:uncharacterized protein EI90DRAFT_3057637 [Cantharellus anzutake]|uniref:uncharacterized protein n=1 Tax=Cantharellus anzutake TaxID=1750568 RepID=UPI001905FD97|nr:uncharacterized protein EI90DRAFT_3057637 [Cantharellus anzutake]KAF8331352.1 hypothetical protein EI90DRAFT_3057637 [Cantharellus anzutake]